MTPAPSEFYADKPWHCATAGEALERLSVSATGLTTANASKALAGHGPNLLAEAKPVSPWAIFFAQFKSILIWILIAASIVSGALGDATDSIVILAVVFLNALVGFYQEYSAEKSIAALKRMTAPRAKVWRDGVVTEIASADVVPGDILELEAGDLIAADARLLQASSLSCVESALTGEAEAVDKSVEALEDTELAIGDRANMAFMGTSVATGAGRGVVVATAMQTEIGRIATLIGEAGESDGTPLQRKLERFGRILLWATLAIVTMLFALGLLRKEPFLDLFMTSVSLAVAALPESLPAVATAALSLGVVRMSRRRALVRRLASVETLGSTNVICTDKTGTLTVGQMTVRVMFVGGQTYDVTGEGYGPDGQLLAEGAPVDPTAAPALAQMAEILVGCNNANFERQDGAWKVIGDPTEGALLCAGQKAGADRITLERDLPKIDEFPFDSDRKLHSVVRRLSGGRKRILTNGAPEMVLAKCSRILSEDGVRLLTDEDRRDLARHNAQFAIKALRVLASAFRDLDVASPARLTQEFVERDLVFAGFAGLYDPPRPEAKEAIAKCRTAGIRVVMITGDHPHTAAAIGKELGLADDGQAMTGVDLDRLTDDVLRDRVSGVGVYARVSAAHKLRIVRAWQAKDAVVAMTGDGVNDAPAIKGADIGVAMGRTGAEVTKQASDMVITDDNFATIVAAVEEGRGIYENIRKTLQYLLACNASELLLMTICIVGGLPAPLLPTQLLWINLVTDGPPALCLAADRVDSDVMQRRPRERDEQIANESFLWSMLFTAALIAGAAFGGYLYGLRSGGLELARTYAFTTLVFAQLLASFGARRQTTPVWRFDVFSNVSLLVVVLASIAVQIWSQHNALFSRFLDATQISYRDGFVLLAASALPSLVLELIKLTASTGPDAAGNATATTSAVWVRGSTTVTLAAIVFAGWFYRPPPPITPSYVTRTAERGVVARTVTVTGAVAPRAKTEILAPVSGVIQFRDCDVGAKIRKGQPCATYLPRASRADHERATASLDQARSQLQKHREQLARAQTGLERIGKSEKRNRLDRARDVYVHALEQTKRCETLVARRELALRAAEGDIQATEVRAPINGTVMFRKVDDGQRVDAGMTLFVVVADLAVAQIEISIDPKDIDKINVGDRASVSIPAAPGRLLEAKVSELRMAQNTIIVAAPNVEGLLDSGMTATVRLEIDRRDNVLRTPNEAIRYSMNRSPPVADADGEFPLWILRGESPTPVAVRLGLDDGGYTEIVGGDLKQGDKLILGEKSESIQN